jgi:hypothetical protein
MALMLKWSSCCGYWEMACAILHPSRSTLEKRIPESCGHAFIHVVRVIFTAAMWGIHVPAIMRSKARESQDQVLWKSSAAPL